MSNNIKYMILNLPSPPGYDVCRGFAGGYGTAEKVNRIEYGHTGYVLLPIFLVYASSALQKMGCRFTVVDGQAFGYRSSQVIDIVLREKPDVLISWISLPSLRADLELLNDIKKSNPNTFIITLGAICNVLPEEILNSKVDLIIQGYYPYYNAILNLVSYTKNIQKEDFIEKIHGVVLKEKDKIRYGLPPMNEEINELSFRVYHLLDVPRYLQHDQKLDGSTLELFPILIDVGCPYPCVHCPYPLGYGNKIIHKSIETIIREIEFLKHEFGITGFIFRAQVFAQNKERVMMLCDELIKRNLKIEWLIESRPNLTSKELLIKMKEAGCFRINFGVESGNQDLLEKIGRSTDIETIKSTFKRVQEIGIWTHAHMILGLPGEDRMTLNNTFNVICDLNPESTSWNFMTPYPGTKFFDSANEKGWIASTKWSEYTSFNPILRTNNLNEIQLLKAADRITWKLRIFRLLMNSSYRKRLLKKYSQIFKK